MSVEQRNAQLIKALGEELYTKVRNTKILVVGAGGIGCELLKNLVLSGFNDIEIIDLDTIDISNLNRQFLFRKEHVGHSKAKVARESALVFNPHVNIIAHHGNIKSHEFGPDYFKKFSLVMNALDNLDARRHVNRICLAAEIPLIESGTAGYLGQVTVIKKDETECFECQPKEAPKTYPVCTIRSNPTAPIHCIVWAKYLFERLFGKVDDANAVTDLQDDKVNEEGTESDPLAKEQKEKGFSNWVFHKVFHTDILKLASMADLWKEKTPPSPLYLPTVLGKLADVPHAQLNFTGMRDQQVWTVLQNAEKLISSLDILQQRKEKEGEMSWDKDDAVALDFVTSASNLRSHIFGIPLLSRFDVKEKAGNIIPAIATTNAIIAGFIVIEAFKIIKGEFHKCRSTYLLKQPSRKRLLLPTALEQKNPSCYVCARSFLKLKINTNTTTLGTLVEKVICGTLGLLEPTVMVGANIIYECGEDADTAFATKQAKKMLTEVNVTHNADMTIEDFMQEMNIQITVIHDDSLEANEFEVLGNVSTTNNRINNNNNNNNNNNTIDDDVQEITPSQKDIESASEPKKRKRSDVL